MSRSTGRLVGRGWATVELERAARELAGDLAPGAGFEEAPRSAVLGARCLRGRAATDGDSPNESAWIVLLEPDTEGRLAGFLARSGEGWAVTWSAMGRRSGSDGSPGPLGHERLLASADRGGPFRLLVSTATIEK